MDMPLLLQSKGVKDLRGQHVDTDVRLWFRCKDNWTGQEYDILNYYFPETTVFHDGVMYLTGAAQVDGHWVLGFMAPDGDFSPL